ncbi:MAG: transposase, partial [candidate division WOR-3 bacterium]
DRKQFIEFLKVSCEIYQVTLLAYVLHKDHYHILIQTARGNLVEFMNHFNIRYATRFNTRHGRTGHLYTSRYRALLVDPASYLLEASRHLHISAIPPEDLGKDTPAHLLRRVLENRWTSLHGYLDKSRAEDFVNYDELLNQSKGRPGYREYLLKGLKPGNRDLLLEVKYGSILGSDAFIANLDKKGLLSAKPASGTDAETAAMTLNPNAILDFVAEESGISRRRLLSRYGDGVARGIASEMLYRYAGLKQREIGRLLGKVHYSGVSHLRGRLRDQMNEDPKVLEHFRQVEKRLREKLLGLKD